MKQIQIRLFALTFLSSIGVLSAQAPIITSAIPVSTTVEQWGKFEIKLNITANWVNPFNYDEIRVGAVFTNPAGQTTSADGFFMQDYDLNTPSGDINPVGSGSFKVRFSPNSPGIWKYTLSCTNAAGTGSFAEQSFQVTAPGNPKNKGFVRSNQTNYLHFDTGEQYIPVGENMCWQNGNPYVDYTRWLGDLSNNGGNFFRLWHASWGLGIEWKNGVNGHGGLRQYKQPSAFYQDWLYDYCAERGICIQLCLHTHGQVSTQVNPEWIDSPYNSQNNGPCANTWDFFTNAAARNHVKNRLRYIVARWGYARSIMNWELFNEVDWTDQFLQRKSDVVNWHAEMAAYLKQIDPYHHLVSSSYALDFNDPALWNQPDMDFTQTHYYINTPNLERALANGVRKYINDFAKPTLTAEFGLGAAGAQLSALDPDGIHIHNGLWGALFGGGFGSGMTWWWDDYIAPKNLYYQFAPVAAMTGIVPFKTGNFSPASAVVSGAPADLSIQPSQGWGALSDTSVTITNGMIMPAGIALGQFLYGSQWNTQFRRPPVFHVQYPAAGMFRVKTGSEAGQSPKIAIWLDGVKVLEQTAAVNQTYSINVPAGMHTIKVDNTGTDWITISGYVFPGLGSGVDAYVVKSDDNAMLAGWVLSNRYNHEYLQANGAPAAVSGASLTFGNIQNGVYTVRYYHCLTGALLSSESVTATNGTLSLALPTLLWDLAFTVTDPSVETVETKESLAFRLFPNPAAPGATISVEFGPGFDSPATTTLLDAEGRTIHTFSERLPAGEQHTLQLHLPADLPAGFYWLKVEGGDGRVGVNGVVVGR